MAVVITAVIAAPAAGVARPRASRAPPPISVAPAAMACLRPGRSPSDSSQPPVPSGPKPPNHPKTFWAPWPKKSPPRSRRVTRMKSFMATAYPIGSPSSPPGQVAGMVGVGELAAVLVVGQLWRVLGRAQALALAGALAA